VGPCSPRIPALLWTGIVFVAMVVLPLTGAQTARGQAATTAPVDMDSLIAAAQDSARAIGVQHVPRYTGAVIGNVSFVQLRNELLSTVNTGFGASATGNLRVDNKRYRLQDRSEQGKLLAVSFQQFMRPDLSARIKFDDTRQFNRVAAIGGRLEDFVLNNRSAEAAVLRQTIQRQRINWDGRIMATALASEKTFKNDDTQWAAVNGGASWGLNVLGTRVSMGARAAYKQTWETSTTLAGINVFDLESFQVPGVEPLGGAEDSVMAKVNIAINDSLSIAADYVDYVGTRSYADQARGSLGSQQVGEENLIWEKETRQYSAVNMILNASPIRGFNLTVRSRHAVSGSDYATQLTRFSETTTDMIGAEMTYATRWGTGFNFRLDRTEQDRNLGPQSTASFNELSRSFVLQATHRLTDRTNVTAGYDTRLTQSFYVDPSNPRDRDQLDNAITARLVSDVWRQKINVTIPFSWTQTDFVNIDQSQSANNRVKTRYDFRPTITYHVSGQFDIHQEYWLAFEFTDFDYNPSDNSLDRNVNFINEFSYRLTPKLSTAMSYRLELHDRGSYTPIVAGGERFFEKDTKDRRDRIVLDVEYRMNNHLSAVVDYDYSQRKDFDVVSGNVIRVTTDGGIEGGVVGRYNWGPGRDLRLILKKANRFGPFNTAAQNDFWIMNSELTYTF